MFNFLSRLFFRHSVSNRFGPQGGLLPPMLGGFVTGAGVVVLAWLLTSAYLRTVAPTIDATEVPTPSAAVIGSPVRIATRGDPARVTLPDGAVLFLDQSSEVELTQLAGTRDGGVDTVLSLNDGRVIVSISLRAGHTFLIRTPNGVLSRVTGSVMGVGYDDSTGQSETYCVEGHCEVEHEGSGDNTGLEGGQSTTANSNGTGPIQQGSGDDDAWTRLGSLLTSTALGGLPTATSTPTPTLSPTPEPSTTPTPDATATRVSFCATFQAGFPGTPCP